MTDTLIPMGETLEREIPEVGLLRFEDFPAGTWTTQKGEPAKKARRRYLLDDVELDSVSSIVGTLSKEALLFWYEDHGCRGAVKAERMGELEGVPEEEWAKRMRFLGLGASAARDEGADRGTAIHAAFEALATTGEIPDPASFPAAWHPWVQGAARAWLALAPEPLASEEIVCNPEQGYAGRLDLRAVVDGERCLVDYKTSKGGRVWPEAHYQTRLYADCAEHCSLEPFERIVIVAVGDDGTFSLSECCASTEDAQALVAVYRARKRLAAGMATQRKVAKA